MKFIEDLKKILTFKKEEKRLKKLYPEADSVTYLSYLDLSVSKTLKNTEYLDTCVAYKSNPFKIYEEKNISGIVSTSIINIEYCSMLSYIVALRIKELIETNIDFYKEILSEYKAIKIDSSKQETPEEILLINDYDLTKYCLGNVNYEFLKVLLKKYNVDEDEIHSIIYELNRPYEGNQLSIESLSSIYSFIHYLIQNKKYDELKELFMYKEQMEEYKKKFYDKFCYEHLTYLLDRVQDPFVTENMEYIQEASEYNKKYFNAKDALSGSILSPQEETVEEVDKDAVIRIAKDFFKHIDPSGKVIGEFEKAYEEGKIVIWNLSEEASIKEYYKDFFLEENTPEKFCYYSPFLKFINVPLTNFIQSVISIIHEFFHYYSGHLSTTINTSYIDEIISIYYETRLCDYLIELGYQEDEVRKFSTTRKSVNTLNDCLSGLKMYFSLMTIKRKHGLITEENIMTTEELESSSKTDDFLLAMIEVLNMSEEEKEELFPTDPKIIKANKCKDMIEKLRNYNFFRLNKPYISYTLGTYIANTQRNEEMDERMLFVAENMYNLEYNDNDLLNIIRFGQPPKLGEEELNDQLRKLFSK